MADGRSAVPAPLPRSGDHRLGDNGRPAAASYYFLSSPTAEIVDVGADVPPERAASTRELAIGLTRRWPEETRRPASMPAWDLVVRAAAPTEQRRRSFISAGRYEGQIPGIDVARLARPFRPVERQQTRVVPRVPLPVLCAVRTAAERAGRGAGRGRCRHPRHRHARDARRRPRAAGRAGSSPR